MTDFKKHNKNMKLPEGYFKDFQKRLFEQLEVDTSFLPKTSGFNVPKGYFATVEQKIVSKTVAHKPKVITMQRVMYVASIAACMLLLVNLGIFTKQPSFDALTASDIEAYIENGHLSLNDIDMAQLFNDDEINTLEITQPEIDENIVVDYLSENVESFDELTLED